MTGREKQEAFITLATNDTYSLGCLVLGCSLRHVNTNRQLVVMVTTGVSNLMRSQLAQVFDHIQEVNVLDSKDPINLALLGRPDLNVTFTKFHCWRLTQYNKAVFLDADTLVLQNIDELFDREELSAAPDAGWPDCFNSGVFVFKPSQQTYESLLNFAFNQGSFDGGDQGLLNMYFKSWATEDISKHLQFIYNVVSQAFYSYLPALTQFKDKVKVIHFIGAVKPWHQTYNLETKTVIPLPGSGHSQQFLQLWWNIFIQMVQPNLDPALMQKLSETIFSKELSMVEPATDQCNIHSDNKMPKNEVVTYIEEKIPMMYPWKPPNVEVFYEVMGTKEDKCHGSRCGGEDKVTELIVIPRNYTELESHYTEEPISHINPVAPPSIIYEATRITEGWGKGNKGIEQMPQVYNSESPIINFKVKVVPLSHDSHDHCPSKPESINDTVYRAPSTTKDVCDLPMEAANSPINLFDELKGMSNRGRDDCHELSDAERKINWERGQIDYLGKDSFENIQRKMEETLKSAAAPDPHLGDFGVTPVSQPMKEPIGKPKPLATEQISEPAIKAPAKTVPTEAPTVKQPSGTHAQPPSEQPAEATA